MKKVWTKEYRKKYMEKWRKENQNHIKRYFSQWRKAHLDYMKQLLKDWRRKNPEKVKKHWRTLKQEKCRQKWHKEKRHKNPQFRLDTTMATVISNALKGKKAGRKWESLVGYNLNDLIKHLEKEFNNKMNWGNYGSYWSIDHRKPRSLFKYINSEDEEFKQCWRLENLQPMEKIANIKKSNSFLL